MVNDVSGKRIKKGYFIEQGCKFCAEYDEESCKCQNNLFQLASQNRTMVVIDNQITIEEAEYLTYLQTNKFVQSTLLSYILLVGDYKNDKR